MLPMPAIKREFIRAVFIGVFLPFNACCNDAPRNLGNNGSGPKSHSHGCVVSSSVRVIRPNRLGSVYTKNLPSSKPTAKCACLAVGASLSNENAPLMPRCASMIFGGISNSRYFARRRTPVIVRCKMAVFRFFGSGSRSCLRRTITAVTVRPVRFAASPRRTVSTSGNSGILRQYTEGYTR